MISYFHRKTLFFLILFFIVFSVQAIDIVRYNLSIKHSDPKQAYYIDLLKLALEASRSEYGDYRLEMSVIEMPQGRTSIVLEQNKAIDVIWRMTSIDTERKLNAVYFPILKGLMGYRIFIIRKENIDLYSKRMSLKRLKTMLAGQGYDWPDSEILRYNDFNVSTGSANHLLLMLKRKRFDYFPRALHEPWIELQAEESLMVEPYLLLKYPAPMYFFVNKNNDRLKKRLTYGLNKLLDSGEFSAFFASHPVTATIIDKANLQQRTIFELTNPLVSKQTLKLLAKDKYWFNLK